MQRQRELQLRCSRTTFLESASPVQTVVAEEHSLYSLALVQPEDGSTEVERFRCPRCGELLTITIRSERLAMRRRVLLWCAAAASFVLAAMCVVALLRDDQPGYLVPVAIFSMLGVGCLVLQSPAMARASLRAESMHFGAGEHGLEYRSDG